MIFVFVFNYFRGLVEFIIDSGERDISSAITFFNDYKNSIDLILNSGMATVIGSVFITVLSCLSENRGIPLAPAVIIFVTLSISILWYVCEALFVPGVESFWITFSLTFLTVLAYIAIVQGNNIKMPLSSDNNISGNLELYK